MNVSLPPVLRIGARKLVRRLGADLVRRRPSFTEIMRRHEIRTVLDVGANIGQFGSGLRAWGFAGRIISFEPIKEAYAALVRRAARDPLWTAQHVGLGDRDGEQVLRVSPDSVFSSVRPMGAQLKRLFPAAAAMHDQTITMRRLDTLWQELAIDGGRVLLKSDTQGYEREVLAGARGVLDCIYGVQLELSTEPLYDGEATMAEVVEFMQASGFALSGIESGIHDPASGRLLQLDCLFLRPDRRTDD